MFRERFTSFIDKNEIINNSLQKIPALVRDKNISEVKNIINNAKIHYGENWCDRNQSKVELGKALNEAVSSGQNDMVMLLADYFVDDLSIRIDSMNVLDYFSVRNNADVVNKLISKSKCYKSDPGYTGSTPLTRALINAVDHGAAEVVDVLLNAGASPNTSYIYYDWCHRRILGEAVKNGHMHIAESLVRHGASIEMAMRGVFIDLIRLTNDNRLYDRDKYEDDDELNARVTGLDYEYRRMIKSLLDYAIGVNFELDENKPNSAYGNTSAIDGNLVLRYFKEGMDVSGFNFVGISIDGVPLRREDLKKYKLKGLNQAFFTVKDWDEHLKRGWGSCDIARYNALTKRLNEMQKLRGVLVDKAGIVDLVPLTEAVLHSNFDGVQTRLKAGIDPNDRSRDLWGMLTNPPIIVAVDQKNEKMVGELLRSPNIKININDFIKSWRVRSEVENHIILRQCVTSNRSDILTFLLSKCDEWKVNVDYYSLIELSMTFKNHDALKLLLPRLDKKEGWNSKWMRCRLYEADTLSILLEHGADINHVDPESGSLVADIIREATNKLESMAGHGSCENMLSGLERRLKFLASKGAHFAESENKDEIIKSFTKVLEPYGKDAGQSFLKLLNEIGVHVPEQEVTSRPGLK